MSDQFRPDVVAGKYDPSLFDLTGETLLVNEIFYSLQGEGLNTGRATIFIRLAKCNLACKFCDTEFETYQRRTVNDILTTVRGMYGEMDLPLIDLTGGEPGLQNCGPLIHKLHADGYKVGIETSGSVRAQWMRLLDHVTISPKVPFDRIPLELFSLASEYKWIVNETFLRLFERDSSKLYIAGAPNFLQPESNNPKWIAAATKLILRLPGMYRMSLQTHKMMGVA